MEKSNRPLVYVPYNAPNSNNNNNNNKNNNQNNEKQDTSSSDDLDKPDKRAPKKRRQHQGYACDKCRERRVGCDRAKPICGQCKDRHKCQYSNHALRLDNISMRQRLDELENTVGWLTSIVANMEQDYQTTVPQFISHAHDVTHSSSSLIPSHHSMSDEQDEKQNKFHGPSVAEWAFGAGWPVLENQHGLTTILTNIKSFDDLSEALRQTVQLVYHTKNTFFPTFDHFAPNSPIPTIKQEDSEDDDDSDDDGDVFSTDTKKFEAVFESLGRYHSQTDSSYESLSAEHILEQDVRTRIIFQHHKCGFPTLVSPSRFEHHFIQGQIKPLVLSSVFSHSVPHACIYHPRLIHLKDFRELGNKFYNHSHDALGIDEPANISNIHQRTFLITYDLDLGRVRRAFLHLGIAIRMCFMLDLHRPEGYLHCKTPFEREQAKRVFWTVWFYDTVIPHFFNDQGHTMRLNQIAIEPPTILPDFDRIEIHQTQFAIRLIEIRKLSVSLSEHLRKEPKTALKKSKPLLWQYYRNVPEHLKFSKKNQIMPNQATIWERRDYFCVLLDYCQCWIDLYRGFVPVGKRGDLSPLELEAIQHTSQAAVASVQLFQAWFQASVQSEDGFDCFFRPYLYHFMSIKGVFSANVSQPGRTPPLVYLSRAHLVLLLQMYRITPTRKSFDESQLEKDMVEFMDTYKISINEVPYQELIDEALVDDPSADGGFSIFSGQVNSEELASRCSSSSSTKSSW
ncbi:hypothetical protein K501DRAFT_336041 [Backusella circina FSU 941]|nr:hypothetical protein K501DRAFT_336041 [Backusella circina FSU 941]